MKDTIPEIRRVRPDWQHPSDDDSNYFTLEPGLYIKTPGLQNNGMPIWTDTETTHIQFYTNDCFGFPLSPVMYHTDAPQWITEHELSRYKHFDEAIPQVSQNLNGLNVEEAHLFQKEREYIATEIQHLRTIYENFVQHLNI